MTQWYYKKDGEKQGPVTSEQLKELATSGELQRTDSVWREGMIKWAKAKAIKGLFAAVANNPTEPPPVPPPVTSPVAEVAPVWQTPEFWKELPRNPLVIGLSFLFCGPLGLVLIAIHPRISRKVKLIGVGCAGAFMLLMVIVTIISIQISNKQILKADTLWEEGKQEKAVAIYKSLARGDSLLFEDQKPHVYGRLIDYELEHEEEAKWEQLGEDRFRISDWEVKARQNGVYAEPESALGREIVWMRDAMRAHEELEEQERLVDAGEKVVLEDHPWYFDRPWYNGGMKKAITEIREKIKATSSQNQMAETKASSETTTSETSSSGGVKVSRGKYVRGNIEIIIEVAPHLTDYVEISNLRVVDPFLLFYLKCDSGTHVPRVYSCYNEDGVKLRQGELSLPSRFNTGETVEGKLMLPHGHQDIDTILIKISSS